MKSSTRCGELAGTLVLGLALAGCSSAPHAGNGAVMLSPGEVRQVAKEAFVYGFPLVTNYQTLYKQAVDTASPDYRAPFNVMGRTTGVATPDDKFVVTPNSDTPYTFLWADLRAEPVVITVPKVETNRYYTGQLIDLYTFNFAYVGTRAFDNDGGLFLLAGPGWRGRTPSGIRAVLRSETQFAYVLFRTQLFNLADTANVRRIQAGYDAKPLSAFLGHPAPEPPAVAWPPPSSDMTTGPALFSYLNFMLRFCPVNPGEQGLMDRFAKLNIGAGKTFDIQHLSAEQQQAVRDGIADAFGELDVIMHEINTDSISSAQMFGSREAMRNDYLHRFAGAKLGLYGNSGEEAVYLGYFVDGEKQPLNGATKQYTLHFPKGGLPPNKAFWSLTMYDGTSQLLVANPLQRYLLNSTMLKSFKWDVDGGLTLYIQHESPGMAQQPNWLPAPDGPFYAVLRIYLPGPDVVSGDWKKPAMEPVPQ